jgi:hypothetical protein
MLYDAPGLGAVPDAPSAGFNALGSVMLQSNGPVSSPVTNGAGPYVGSTVARAPPSSAFEHGRRDHGATPELLRDLQTTQGQVPRGAQTLQGDVPGMPNSVFQGEFDVMAELIRHCT